mmetsp:Transcript_25487/g.68998  ORF Transcript_25487/g.68998 Transcript_25487/m.68998 type:complete len:220 (+) Transcript_25487:727-1386(+)
MWCGCPGLDQQPVPARTERPPGFSRVTPPPLWRLVPDWVAGPALFLLPVQEGCSDLEHPYLAEQHPRGDHWAVEPVRAWVSRPGWVWGERGAHLLASSPSPREWTIRVQAAPAPAQHLLLPWEMSLCALPPPTECPRQEASRLARRADDALAGEEPPCPQWSLEVATAWTRSNPPLTPLGRGRARACEDVDGETREASYSPKAPGAHSCAHPQGFYHRQ